MKHTRFQFEVFPSLGAQFANLETALKAVGHGAWDPWIKEALENGQGACTWMTNRPEYTLERQRCEETLRETQVPPEQLKTIVVIVGEILANGESGLPFHADREDMQAITKIAVEITRENQSR